MLVTVGRGVARHLVSYAGFNLIRFDGFSSGFGHTDLSLARVSQAASLPSRMHEKRWGCALGDSWVRHPDKIKTAVYCLSQKLASETAGTSVYEPPLGFD